MIYFHSKLPLGYRLFSPTLLTVKSVLFIFLPMAKKNRYSYSQHSQPLSIVGIGASAGSLAALKTFFSHVPENSGFAFVIVVHLSPEHKSHLAELLQPHINIPVKQVTETMPLEANHIYVIPPGCNLN